MQYEPVTANAVINKRPPLVAPYSPSVEPLFTEYRKTIY